MATPYADRFSVISDDLWLSEFRLLPGHPSWHRRGRTTDGVSLIAFPRTAVAIRQENKAEVVADPLRAVVYGPGQPYTRRLISPAGDDCTILAVSNELLGEVIDDLEIATDPVAHGFPFSATQIDRADNLAIENACQVLRRCDSNDRDALRETLYWVLHRVIGNGYAETFRARKMIASLEHLELADAVLEELGRDVANNASLADLAKTFAVSPFHLVRTFRSVTGRPIHAYRTELRLRASLPLLADGFRVVDVAQQLGFASHAHLTERFTRAYGMTPSRWRESVAKSSKNVKAV